MKRLISLLVVVVCAASMMMCETLHISKAYVMKKSKEGYISMIRVYVNNQWKDWYVCGREGSNVFYGYESDDEIIVDTLIDIAIIK